MSDPHRVETPAETVSLFSKKSDEIHRGHGRARERRGERAVVLALDAPGPSPLHAPEIAEDRLDPEAIKVIARLRYTGHEAYFVGGCVRDVLLGRVPKDFDVA